LHGLAVLDVPRGHDEDMHA